MLTPFAEMLEGNFLPTVLSDTVETVDAGTANY
jgi:hypothetical protein